MDGARGLLVLAVLAARLAPRSLLAADVGLCPFRLVTGRPCPAARSVSSAIPGLSVKPTVRKFD